MTFSGVFVIVFYGLLFNRRSCFPDNRNNDRLSDLKYDLEDLRRELKREGDYRREDITTLYEVLSGSTDLDENEPKERKTVHVKPVYRQCDNRLEIYITTFDRANSHGVHLRNDVSDIQGHFVNDITRTHGKLNDSATQFLKETVKMIEDLLLEVKHMEDVYNQKLLSESEEKGHEFRKSSMLVKSLIQNINVSIDNFTSQVKKYSSRISTLIMFSNIFAKTYIDIGNEGTKKPGSCQDVHESGVHTIYPDFKPAGLEVYCEIDQDKDWLVIQRRKDGTVDFDRSWEEYKAGFGDLSGDFWLGNEYIYQMTKYQSRQLRIDMETFDGKKAYAIYAEFGVSSEPGKYRLVVKGFSGDVDDSLTIHNGHMFSTYNSDNDSDSERCCSCTFSGGWWFYSCYNVHLNGKYYYTHETASSPAAIYWNGLSSSLKYVDMKIH